DWRRPTQWPGEHLLRGEALGVDALAEDVVALRQIGRLAERSPGVGALAKIAERTLCVLGIADIADGRLRVLDVWRFSAWILDVGDVANLRVLGIDTLAEHGALSVGCLADQVLAGLVIAKVRGQAFAGKVWQVLRSDHILDGVLLARQDVRQLLFGVFGDALL